MTSPITITFTNGLAPSVYADVMAVAEGDDTARSIWLSGDRDRARLELERLALLFGFTSEVVRALTGGDEDGLGPNYGALTDAIVARVRSMRGIQGP